MRSLAFPDNKDSATLMKVKVKVNPRCWQHATRKQKKSPEKWSGISILMLMEKYTQ